MIEFTRGDMFTMAADARVNTVNCKGVMGAGVALAFKQRFPDMFKDYQRACRSGAVKPGKLHVWRNLSGDWVINFPTKRDWREQSRYEDIEAGLDALREYLKPHGPITVALPALGCGNGGLDWTRVSSMIKERLSDIEARILVFEPADSHTAEAKAQAEPTPDEIRALRNLGFEYGPLTALPCANGKPTRASYRGDMRALSGKWIALMPARSPSDREQAALRAVARQLCQAPDAATVALVHATRATEQVAEAFRQEGVPVVMILPFGPLTRQKIFDAATSKSSSMVTTLSLAAPSESWSRQLFVQAMSFLRARAAGVLISDPDPDWLSSGLAASLGEVPVFYIRYEANSHIAARLQNAGARPIGRKAETGEPNIDALLAASKAANNSAGEATPAAEDDAVTGRGQRADDAAESPGQPSEPGGAPDFYALFVQRLGELTAGKAMPSEEIAASLALEKAQVAAWLKRGVAEGRIQKQLKPPRYKLAMPRYGQASLFGAP
ncbi:macro domain-containing protein [Roseococcus microcysteis]|uniref:macro domain-containing protein n=1 Tax=Roseococcus microcysteis TaxID=2771361 RepID=UPI00168BE800|nr:macro domain-containing protein [Roseococcus microcysteis]